MLDLNQRRKFDNYDLDNTVFNFMLPRGTILKYDDDQQNAKTDASTNDTLNSTGIPEVEESDSLNGLGGYHGSVINERGSGQSTKIYYSIAAYSEFLPDGQENGIAVFDESWKNVVATLYHEINEFKTYPDVEDAIRQNENRFIGWNSDKGEEIGDFPVFEARPLSKVFKEVPLSNDNRRYRFN